MTRDTWLHGARGFVRGGRMAARALRVAGARCRTRLVGVTARAQRRGEHGLRGMRLMAVGAVRRRVMGFVVTLRARHGDLSRCELMRWVAGRARRRMRGAFGVARRAGLRLRIVRRMAAFALRVLRLREQRLALVTARA